jgi:hypothetical protein
MGPVWKLVKGVKDLCSQCGEEIVDFPAVGRIVDFQFLPSEKFCWSCYKYNAEFIDRIDPQSAHPFQPVTKPLIP